MKQSLTTIILLCSLLSVKAQPSKTEWNLFKANYIADSTNKGKAQRAVDAAQQQSINNLSSTYKNQDARQSSTVSQLNNVRDSVRVSIKDSLTATRSLLFPFKTFTDSLKNVRKDIPKGFIF